MTPVPATLPDFLSLLAATPDLGINFIADGTPIEGGYHVTEFRSARIDGIDCAGRVDAWGETQVQLLDGHPGAPDPWMPAHKFSSIATRSMSRIPTLAEGRLVFDYAPGNGAAKRWEVAAVAREGETLTVHLAAERAACKPYRDGIAEATDRCTSCAPAAPAVSARSSCCG